MNIVRTLVGVYRLEIEHVTDNPVLVTDTIATVHVTGNARNIQGLSAIVSLHQADEFNRCLAFIEETSKT